LINHVIYLGDISSQNPQMDGSVYVTNGWEYTARLISCHCIVCRALLFPGMWENAAECEGSLIWWVVMVKQL